MTTAIRSTPSRWTIAFLVSLMLAAFLVAAEALSFSGLLPEKRPALLEDAQWKDPGSAKAFRGRFPAGSEERDLVSWLKENRFDLDRQTRRASRYVSGFPCRERLDIKWSAGPDHRLRSADATVFEAGCP
jgi:hypothetical protein